MSLEDEDDGYIEPEVADILKYKGRGFDHRVQILHPRTGELLKVQPYRMTVTQSKFGIIKIYERDGKTYWENGEPASREDLVDALGENHSFLTPPVKRVLSPAEKRRTRRSAA